MRIIYLVIILFFIPCNILSAEEPPIEGDFGQWYEEKNQEYDQWTKKSKKVPVDINSNWINPFVIKNIEESSGLEKDQYESVVNLDGIRYHVNSLIEAFTMAAFSDHLWYEDYSMASAILKIRLHNRIYKNIESEYPEINVVNKWVKPIKISLKTLRNNKEVDVEKYSYLIDHIKKIAAVYSEATGLSISYEHDHFPDRKANFYIILDTKSDFQNAFKNRKRPWGEYSFEMFIPGGVRFTPDITYQVEGFFVPNKNNEIEYASCYLKPSLISAELTEGLTTECITRALGFPEMTNLSKESILSNWNFTFQNVSASEKSLQMKNHSKWLESLKAELSKKHRVIVMPSEFDLMLVRAMYCRSIKPKMDKYELILSHINNEECIK